MKKQLLTYLLPLVLAGCGVNKQVKYTKALEDCKYDILSADSIYIANVNAKDLAGKDGIDYTKAPRLALAFLRKEIPLDARVNLKVSNPGRKMAAINEFEYKILLENRQLAEGFSQNKVTVGPGSTVVVPILINSNIYGLLSDKKTQNAIADFVLAPAQGEDEKKSKLTIKIKPTIEVGSKKIKYPGYITIDKEISRKILL